jgi:hypothetical protein
VTRREELDARARLLRAAVGFALVPPTEPELRVLHQWLDCWRGVGDVVTGMNRQGYEVSIGDHGEASGSRSPRAATSGRRR